MLPTEKSPMPITLPSLLERHGLEPDLAKLAEQLGERQLRDLAMCYLQGDTCVRSASKMLPIFNLCPFHEITTQEHIKSLNYAERLTVADLLLGAEQFVEDARRLRGFPLSTDKIRE